MSLWLLLYIFFQMVQPNVFTLAYLLIISLFTWSHVFPISFHFPIFKRHLKVVRVFISGPSWVSWSFLVGFHPCWCRPLKSFQGTGPNLPQSAISSGIMKSRTSEAVWAGRKHMSPWLFGSTDEQRPSKRDSWQLDMTSGKAALLLATAGKASQVTQNSCLLIAPPPLPLSRHVSGCTTKLITSTERGKSNWLIYHRPHPSFSPYCLLGHL